MPEVKRDLAFALFDEGKRPADAEVKALGLKAKTTYNYFQMWKKGDTTSAVAESSTLGSQRVGGKAIEVGKITITPETWALSQYGSLLILDTYNKTKRDIGYTGTIGEFLCDMCEFYRRIVNYKEVDHDTAASEGSRGVEENGQPGTGKVGELVK